MNLREFITLLGGAAAWPLAARAQQAERIRRIGVLMTIADDPEGSPMLRRAREALQKLGWAEGGNVRIDTRWPASDADRTRAYAAELVELQPDVILSGATSALAPPQQATRTIEREPSSCRPCAKSVTL